MKKSRTGTAISDLNDLVEKVFATKVIQVLAPVATRL